MNPESIFSLLFLVGGMLAVVGLFVGPIIYFGIKHENHKREMEHAERMRAIECGYPLDGDLKQNPAVALGVGVPAIAFGLAMGATFFNAGLYAWPAAGAASVAAVICGTVLALKRPVVSPRDLPSSLANGKLVGDPDTFDVAGRRG